MKVQIKRALFTQLIGKLQSIVPSKPSLPILGNILVEAREGQLTMSGTDLTVSMRLSGEANVEEEGAIALPARRLFQLVRELTTPEIEMETTSPEGITLRAGSSHFKIQGMHKSEFPAFPDLTEGAALDFKTEALKEMLTRTAFAAARDDSRQVLNGILLQTEEKEATFVATDGKRLARNQIELENSVETAGQYILPLKAVEETIKLLDDEAESSKLTLMDEKLSIEVGSVVLITKLLAGQYPDVTRVIPPKSEGAVTLHREELVALLRQVALFTAEGSYSVRFTFSQGVLHLTAASSKIGEGKVSMPVNFEGETLEIAFNPHSFLDILRHTKDDTVLFDVSDSYTPGLLTDSSKAEFVIMPMRLESLAEA